ncbi:hypothetical protein [Methanoculleus chikugoensis]|uniref:hypothetical protein n=1 Tax=Methanoculleus chikugoensis TaxID=118126 RepID=UPI0006D12AA2|nr:hypothetical protein [Methanoculleus chikugoensis]
MSREYFHRHAPELLIAFFGLIFLVAAFGGEIGGGEAGAFLTSALDVAPFVILAMLVYLARTRHPLFRWIAVLWLLVVVAGLAAIATGGFGAIAILPAGMLEAEEIDPETVDLALAAQVALLLLGVLVAGGLASLVGLSRRFRGGWLAGGYLPFDPDSLLHTVALVVILAMILIPPVPLLVAGVPPPLLSAPFLDLLLESGDLFAESVTLNAYTLFWTLVGSFFIAGAFVRRTGARDPQTSWTRPPDGERGRFCRRCGSRARCRLPLRRPGARRAGGLARPSGHRHGGRQPALCRSAHAPPGGSSWHPSQRGGSARR